MGEPFHLGVMAYTYQLATAYTASRREQVACIAHGSMSMCVSLKISAPPDSSWIIQMYILSKLRGGLLAVSRTWRSFFPRTGHSTDRHGRCNSLSKSYLFSSALRMRCKMLAILAAFEGTLWSVNSYMHNHVKLQRSIHHIYVRRY
jgi:hypothetical protein